MSGIREVGPEDDDETDIGVPAAFGALLELELGRSDHPAMGFAAQVPHYLTRTDFPPAGALALLRRVSGATGLDLPPLVDLGGDLTEAATAAIESTLVHNAEVRQIVTALEQQYDAMKEGGRLSSRDHDGSPDRRGAGRPLRALPGRPGRQGGPRRLGRARRLRVSLCAGPCEPLRATQSADDAGFVRFLRCSLRLRDRHLR